MRLSKLSVVKFTLLALTILSGCKPRIDLSCQTTTAKGVREIYLISFSPSSNIETRQLIEKYVASQENIHTRIFYKRNYFRNPGFLGGDDGFNKKECSPFISENILCIAQPSALADSTSRYFFSWFIE